MTSSFYEVEDEYICEKRNRYREDFGLKERQYNYNINTTAPVQGQESVYKHICLFSERFVLGEKQEGLLIVGGVGCGKTHMVVSIVNYIVDYLVENGNQYTVYFSNIIELIEKLRLNENNLFWKQWLREYDLLIIDDLGAESSNAWTRERLFEIIDYRYNMNLPIVITTNCVPEELKEKVGDRCFDRIREMCVLVSVTAKSQRKTATFNEEQRDSVKL